MASATMDAYPGTDLYPTQVATRRGGTAEEFNAYLFPLDKRQKIDKKYSQL